MSLLRTTVMLGVLASLAVLGRSAQAGPLLGQDLAFEQLPLNGGLAPSSGGSQYAGHSEYSTANPGLLGFSWEGTYMADDFSLTTSDPVYHVDWWGSYLNAGNGGGVQQFLISFETDVAATANDPSHPGTMVISQVVSKGVLAPNSGTFTEAAIPSASGQLYHYSAELEIPMLQIAGDVYWLKIVALVNPDNEGDVEWGWQDRDYTIQDALASGVPTPGEHLVANGLGLPLWHFQDDAVTGDITAFPVPATNLMAVQPGTYDPQNYIDGLDGPAGIGEYGKDLAFQLYTQPVPEPSTIVLLGMGGVAVAVVLRRRRRR